MQGEEAHHQHERDQREAINVKETSEKPNCTRHINARLPSGIYSVVLKHEEGGEEGERRGENKLTVRSKRWFVKQGSSTRLGSC